MTKKQHVVIVFNEPTITTTDGRKFVTDAGLLKENLTKANVMTMGGEAAVDMSEVGVLDQLLEVQTAIQSQGYRSSLFNMNGDLKRLIHFLADEHPDLVFNLCESIGSNALHEMHVAGVYELMSIPYTGSGPLTLGTCLKKARAKEIMSYHGIPTPKFAIVHSASSINGAQSHLRYPVFVKPANEDASSGIDNESIVTAAKDLKGRVEMIMKKFDQPALVEEYIDGRELNVAVIGNTPPQVLPISEIDFSGLPDGYPHIVTYSAKWHEGTAEFYGTKGICPAELPAKAEKDVRSIAVKAYTILACRDYARVDIRMTQRGEPFVLEVNPNPDLSSDAGFARSIRAAGMTYEEGIGKIVSYALERTVSL